MSQSPELRAMAGELGDIFWDLPPWITYSPGFDLGCTIYVANATDSEKEYALMGKLSRNTTLISEESLPVYGYAWFKVAPGDFVRLHGALRFEETDADLTVSLVERESEQVTDSVSTRLVTPTAGALPPAWPGVPGVPGFDWGSLLSMFMPVMMMGVMGMVIVSAVKPAKEKEEGLAVKEERKLLPPGREE